MNGFSGTSDAGGMYVKALYDYQADDRTSLSFRTGDIIQVITQLESGWWDGVIHGVRGWFPSNYCAVVQRPSEDVEDDREGADADDDHDARSVSGAEGDYSDADSLSAGNDTILPIERNGPHDKEEEAAFWIPQATPDGRLFYFNTLTGVSTMNLPLESPSANESGPRNRTDVFIPEMSRPPAELLASGSGYNMEDTDDETSASDFEGPGNKGSYSSRHRQRLSGGLSSATSMESMNAGYPNRSYDQSGMSFAASTAIPPTGTTATSFANSPGLSGTDGTSRKFYDDVSPVPLTWNRMVEDMRRAIERYKQAINNSDRSEFVKRAEDISDHLRLLLAAGSGTTDNHSGNPSIISTNKALYPHFRETMSRFSKLVLSSHIAASDFPPPDSYSKCLKEAEGVLNGVFGFVEVARQQRGEEIPRLVPGFVVGNLTGGSWQNNGTDSHDANTSLFSDLDDYEPPVEPTLKLDSRILERLQDLRRLITSNLRRLDEQLVLRDTVISHRKHQAIGEHVCNTAGKVLESCRPWLSTIEQINLASLDAEVNGQQLNEFSVQKQKAYDVVSELVIACQGVAAPLGDEWAELRGDSLEDRINAVRAVTRDLEATCTHQYGLLQSLSDTVPLSDIVSRGESRRNTDGELASHARGPSGPERPLLGNIPKAETYSAGTPLTGDDGKVEPVRSANSNKKIKDFFGEVPVIPQQAIEETPEFLKLDHEGEISYDHKSTPPQLKGGTLAGLVEQLTRHDRLDPAFNNTFLLTYRSFTTASELFEMLVKRWSIQPPHGLDKDDYQHWVDKKQKPIRFRVVNILKSWFDNYWMEGNDEEARILIQRVYNFAKDHVATTSTPGAAPLMTSVEQRSRGPDMPTKRLVLTLSAQTPQPILPKHMKKLKFLDIDATEFARQLTIIESRLYGKIRPTECLNKTWQKKLSPGEPDPAANVKALILHSNQLTNWVAQMILTQQDVKRRVIVIKHFVNVADKCRQLNNFSTLTSIISALGTAPIHRLNRTWSAVNQRSMATLESMRKLMGVYLTDLTFIEDGIPSLIKRTNLINFAKRAKTAEVIRDIQQYQNVPYPLQPVPELQDYILTNMQSAGDVHEMYEMSLSVEPREREDEKIARLLSESGFL
ncbi:cell division control protein 25 [Pyrenophora tritici-repentis Pt-1C-BFP]|uniref:Class E vacuolar protein-sorting machinery protein HSE1 n=1 Tax=Pyrenophora tritici-repentis (strain Pt-1C-BFP) TaxID=426418 RepID=B2W6S7_PYRTR|nr:cell division control protein 25 [Pyrenophora tritici-repentis Pt-1C-BFP]EDU48435.1 cell division control protein 25 [Pyrenophora tritici-repentis Pt-1C-BFP]